jgi:hypothetical protein
MMSRSNAAAAVATEEGDETVVNATAAAQEPTYDYLLRVSTLSCTTEYAEKLRRWSNV